MRGTNNHGLWSESATFLDLKINPPWWETSWFRILGILLVLSFVTALYRYRVARLLEMERLRVRIASDLHDDLGGKLSSIALLSDMVQRRSKLPQNDEKRLSRVTEMSQMMVGELRDIVWFIAPEHDNVDDLITKMHNVAEARLVNKSYRIEIADNVRGEGLNMDARRHFMLCYKEILHNIVKHADASSVHISLQKIDDWLILSIEDDGKGFDMTHHGDGHGLQNLRRRAEQMNGRIEFESTAGKGTTVTLHVKILKVRDARSLRNFYASVKQFFLS